MLNCVKNHLTFEIKDPDSKPYKYIITCSTDCCSECKDDESKYIFTQGKDTFKEPWIKTCLKHITILSAKKQHCNICNKKSKIIDNLPKLCDDCYQHLYDNHIELQNTCKFPVVSIQDCNCKFCKMR